MKVEGVFKFMGVVSKPSFKDPTKTNYIVGLGDLSGIDSYRPYVDLDVFNCCKDLPAYSDVSVVFDFNPVAEKVSYCLKLVSLKPVSSVSVGSKG